jgi:protein-tyrosine sulfotransferase
MSTARQLKNMFSSIRKMLNNNLSHATLGKLRDLAYKFAYRPSTYSQIAQKIILILGCQRSGNTLTYLMLNVHPSIHGVDEGDVGYKFPKSNDLNARKNDETLVALKFPTQTARINYIFDYLASAKIIWPIRNPYAVISSMLKWKQKKGNWIAVYAREELWQHSFLFPEIMDLDLAGLDDVSLGAYVWKYKERVLQMCKQSEVPTFAFQYESLLDDPRKLMQQIITFLGLKWDENVLNHQNNYSPEKRYPGGTDGSKALDRSRKKPELLLSKHDIEIITEICGPEMATHSYYAPDVD